jgi:putative hemolysin
MRVAIAAVGFAALAYVFCCQNAGSRHDWNSDQGGGGCRFARDANAVSPVLLARLS